MQTDVQTYCLSKFQIIFVHMQYENSKWKSLILFNTNFAVGNFWLSLRRYFAITFIISSSMCYVIAVSYWVLFGVVLFWIYWPNTPEAMSMPSDTVTWSDMLFNGIHELARLFIVIQKLHADSIADGKKTYSCNLY